MNLKESKEGLTGEKCGENVVIMSQKNKKIKIKLINNYTIVFIM